MNRFKIVDWAYNDVGFPFFTDWDSAEAYIHEFLGETYDDYRGEYLIIERT
jgi:hypothetical protein